VSNATKLIVEFDDVSRAADTGRKKAVEAAKEKPAVEKWFAGF